MHLDPVSLECRHISLSYGSNEVRPVRDFEAVRRRVGA